MTDKERIEKIAALVRPFQPTECPHHMQLPVIARGMKAELGWEPSAFEVWQGYALVVNEGKEA